MENADHAFSADLPARFAAGPPGHAPVAAVRDVVLVTTDPSVTGCDLDAYPPILMPTYPNGPGGGRRDPDPIDLGRGIELTRLDHGEAERVMNACQPRGHFFAPVRQYGQRYTFQVPVAREEWEQHLYGWDREGLLTDALQLSRLILDNGWSTENGARIIEHEDGQQQIMWLTSPDPVYRLQRERDYFTAEEAAALRELLSAYWEVRDSLPARVKRAIWNAEFMCRVRWLDIRVPLLVIAFEGLVSTSQSLVRRQFRERVPRLVEEAGVEGISPGLCDNLYGARSRWAHGSHIALRPTTKKRPAVDGDEQADEPVSQEEEPAPGIVEEIALFQTALRVVVRRCIEDLDFAVTFNEDDGIRTRWPVTL